MYIKNATGRIVDVSEAFEESMCHGSGIEIISVSQHFIDTHPEQYARLKRDNPLLMTDEFYLGTPKTPQASKKERITITKKLQVKVPKNKIHFVIYPNYLPKVGGIETAVYQLAKLLDRKKYFVTIAYNCCESEEAMKKYAEVSNLVKLEDKVLDCDVCLLASNHLEPPQIKAKLWMQWVHSDYEKYNSMPLADNPHVKQYISVSKHVAKIFKKLYKKDCAVIYNLLDPDFGKKAKKPVRFVTNARLSPEKGFDMRFGDSKMFKFAKLLKASGIPFLWTICGDNTHMPNEDKAIRENFKDIEEVQFVGYKSDVTLRLTEADYLVQLSDFEGCPYTVLEALQMGIPCIVSEWKGVEELVKDGVNGYIINQDIDNVNIKKILTKIPKGFDTTPKSSIGDWEKLIDKVNHVQTRRTKTR